MVVYEKLESIPDGFISNGPASPDTNLNLKIGLTSNNVEGLEKSLYDVSIPGSASYGKHLTKEEVETFVAPSSETVNQVNTWLSANDITVTTISPAGDWISISIPVSKANSIFSTSFETFTHTSTNIQYIRTLSYSIPSGLQGHIDVVHPTISFTPPFTGPNVFTASVPSSGNITSDAVPPACANGVVPACLQSLYGIPATPATQPSNTLAVPGFLNEYANQADLQSFLSKFRADLPSNTTFAFASLDGGQNLQNPSQAGLEANLDIQYTIGIASNVPTLFISVGKNSHDGISGFLDVVRVLSSLGNPPKVLSTSYGFDETRLSPNVARALCNGYMQLGARGISVIFSSGDGGVAGNRPVACSIFIPTFPSTCPFVTSVGATTNFSPETAATLSSGGFSNIFSAHLYQAAAISSYFITLRSTYAGRFNPSGRAFPDVSAQGKNINIIHGGKVALVDGTSASAPIFASIIALLNDQLAAIGRPPLGFLNPFLYSPLGSTALTDITSGSNPGCGTSGFPATPGWDPVTGLGSPNFAKLRAAVGL